MGEGIDPTQMCQTLVHRVAQSRQLTAVTDPAILTLFENWLEELEDEVTESLRRHPTATPAELADSLGMSKSGAAFLIAKLARETGL